MGAGAAGVHDALGNALVIEMGDFLAKDEVFQKRRTPWIGLERILIVRKRDPLVRGECGVLSSSYLVQLTAGGPVCVRDCTLTLLVLSGKRRSGFAR